MAVITHIGHDEHLPSLNQPPDRPRHCLSGVGAGSTCTGIRIMKTFAYLLFLCLVASFISNALGGSGSYEYGVSNYAPVIYHNSW